jgi:hypothetical protein
MPYQRPRIERVILPLQHCPSCGRDHPKPKGSATGTDSPFLNSAQLAGFYGVAVATIHSKKSRGELPPTLRGRSTPLWDSCVAAAFLHTGSTEET